MKPSLMCYIMVIYMFHNKTQGIWLEKSSVLARNHQYFITKSLSSTPDVESALVTHEPLSGIIRKLMAKTIPTNSTTKNYENDLKTDLKLTRDQVGRVETSPDVIDITGMDNSLANRKSPIHNLNENKSYIDYND